MGLYETHLHAPCVYVIRIRKPRAAKAWGAFLDRSAKTRIEASLRKMRPQGVCIKILKRLLKVQQQAHHASSTTDLTALGERLKPADAAAKGLLVLCLPCCLWQFIKCACLRTHVLDACVDRVESIDSRIPRPELSFPTHPIQQQGASPIVPSLRLRAPVQTAT